jgi:hypothetical protein
MRYRGCDAFIFGIERRVKRRTDDVLAAVKKRIVTLYELSVDINIFAHTL